MDEEKINDFMNEVEMTGYHFNCPFCPKEIESLEKTKLVKDARLHIQTHEMNWYGNRCLDVHISCPGCDGKDTKFLTLHIFDGIELWKCNDCEEVFIHDLDEKKIEELIE